MVTTYGERQMWLRTLTPPDGRERVRSPTTCQVYWGAHFDEHACAIPVEEHGDSPDWHECDCGAEYNKPKVIA